MPLSSAASILSGSTFRGRRSLVPSSISVSFFSDSASTIGLPKIKKNVDRNINLGDAPSHNRVLRLRASIRGAHARQHTHHLAPELNGPFAPEQILPSLISLCHDVCSTCHAPHLDVLHEGVNRRDEPHLKGLIDDLKYIESCIIHL
jgi:hypothetical protein